MINILICLAALGTAPGDVVTTRDGKTVEGTVVEYDRFVDVEQSDGKKERIPRWNIAKIDLATPLLTCPEVAPLPNVLPEIHHKNQDFYSFGRILVAVDRLDAGKVVAVDFQTGVKIWEKTVRHRIRDPILAGRDLIFMQKEKFVDDSIKYQIDGTPYSKDIHRLTVTAYKLDTGEVSWQQVWDNNTGKDSESYLWEFVGNDPTIHVLTDRIVVRTEKRGLPIDRRGNVDRKKAYYYATIYAFDPFSEKPKPLPQIDSSEVAEAKGEWYFTSKDTATCRLRIPGGRWQFAGIEPRRGKIAWKGETFTGILRAVLGDHAYVTDSTHMRAYSIANGKPVKNWAIEYKGGSIVDQDYRHVFYFRVNREPRAIIGYDTDTAKEVFRIPMPPQENFEYLIRAGHRILYTSQKGLELFCYDTIEKKQLWSWKGRGRGRYTNPVLVGRGLVFYKDGTLTCLDLDTGRAAWETPGTWIDVIGVGRTGVLLNRRLGGWDILRQRDLPEGSMFLNPTGTPLRFLTGESNWSVPWIGDNEAWVLSAAGNLIHVDTTKDDVPKGRKVSTQLIRALSPPVVRDGRVVVGTPPLMQIFDPEKPEEKSVPLYHSGVTSDRQFWSMGKDVLLLHSGTLKRSEFPSGTQVWMSKVRGIRQVEVADDRLHVLTTQAAMTLDPETGDPLDQMPIPRNATLMAVGNGVVFVAAGPNEAGTTSGRSSYLKVAESPRDPRDRRRFGGALAAEGSLAAWTNAAGTVVGLDGDSGKKTWTHKTPEFTSPLLAHGGRVYFAAPGEGLFGLNLKTGAVEWDVKLRDPENFTPFLLSGKPAFWSSEGWLIKVDPGEKKDDGAKKKKEEGEKKDDAKKAPGKKAPK